MQYPNLDEVQRQHEPQQRSSLMDDMPVAQAPSMQQVSNEPPSRNETMEEDFMNKLEKAKKMLSWRQKRLRCCSSCLGIMSVLIFMCTAYHVCIWPPPYYMEMLEKQHPNGDFNPADFMKPPMSPQDGKFGPEGKHHKNKHHEKNQDQDYQTPEDWSEVDEVDEEEYMRHHHGRSLHGDKHHGGKDHEGKGHHGGKYHHKKPHGKFDHEESPFAEVFDKKTLKQLNKLDHILTKLAIVTMIWCTFLFFLSSVGRRASKQKTYKDTRRFMKPAGILTLILIFISIYSAHLKIKFGHELTNMMKPENGQMDAYMSSRKLSGKLPTNFNEQVIDTTSKKTLGQSIGSKLTHNKVRNGRKDRLRSTSSKEDSTKIVKTNNSDNAQIQRSSKVDTSRITGSNVTHNAGKSVRVSGIHGRNLRSAKSMIQKAVNRISQTVKTLTHEAAAIKEVESHLQPSNINHNNNIPLPKQKVAASQPRVSQEQPEIDEKAEMLLEEEEEKQDLEDEFSLYLSTEDMERMEQLITGINEWANKYNKDPEMFYPEVEEFVEAEEDYLDELDDEAMYGGDEDFLWNEDEVTILGGDDHDFWWANQEEDEQDDELYGIIINISEDGEFEFEIERDTWMGFPTNADNSKLLGMTLDVPDTWDAWTAKEKEQWLEYFDAEDWEGVDWQQFNWQDLFSYGDELDMWSDEDWEDWAVNQQMLVLEHDGSVPEYWEYYSEEDRMSWASFFRPEDWAGYPTWRRFDWEDLDNYDCDNWSESDWTKWANQQQNFWDKNGEKAPNGFQFWGEKDQIEWLVWFNPSDWVGLSWQKFDWADLENYNTDEWKYEDWANWAMKQQSIVETTTTYEYPNDWNEWDEEDQIHFKDNFKAEEWKRLDWKEFEWTLLGDEDYKNWSHDQWRQWQLEQQLIVLLKENALPEFFNTWEEKDQLSWASFFRPEEWRYFKSWRKFDWADPTEKGCENWSEADWINWAIEQQTFWDTYGDRAPLSFQYWSEKDQKDWLSWFNLSDWEGVSWKKFDWADLANFDVESWATIDWERWAARQQATVEKQESETRRYEQREDQDEEERKEPEVPNGFEKWSRSDKDYFLDHFDPKEWEEYDWKEFGWMSLHGNRYDKWNEQKWHKWAKQQQKKVDKREAKELGNEPWGFEYWDLKDQLTWKVWFNVEDWEGYDWFNFDWADLDNYNTNSWNKKAWIKWADSQQLIREKYGDIVPEGWQYWNEEDQKDWLKEFDLEDWEGYDWKKFNWGDLDKYDDLDDWNDRDWEDWADWQQDEVDDQQRRERKDKKQGQGFISKIKNWIKSKTQFGKDEKDEKVREINERKHHKQEQKNQKKEQRKQRKEKRKALKEMKQEERQALKEQRKALKQERKELKQAEKKGRHLYASDKTLEITLPYGLTGQGRRLSKQHVMFYVQTSAAQMHVDKAMRQNEGQQEGHKFSKGSHEKPMRDNGRSVGHAPPHHGGKKCHVIFLTFLFNMFLISHLCKICKFAKAHRRHEYLNNILANGEEKCQDMDQRVKFYEQAAKAQKKQKKAVQKQLAPAKATNYIPPSEPLLAEDRVLVDPEQEPLNYSFYQAEPNVPTYTLEQVQTLLNAQQQRIVDQFNRQVIVAPPTGEQLANELTNTKKDGSNSNTMN